MAIIKKGSGRRAGESAKPKTNKPKMAYKKKSVIRKKKR
jgi:hypothetical protein